MHKKKRKEKKSADCFLGCFVFPLIRAVHVFARSDSLLLHPKNEL